MPAVCCPLCPGWPDDGEGIPEDGDGRPLDGVGRPLDGEGKPLDGDGRPPDGDGNPADGDGIPDEGDGIPLEGDGMPPDGEGIPPDGDGIPDDGDDGEGIDDWLAQATRPLTAPATRVNLISLMSSVRISHLVWRRTARRRSRGRATVLVALRPREVHRDSAFGELEPGSGSALGVRADAARTGPSAARDTKLLTLPRSATSRRMWLHPSSEHKQQGTS